MEMKHYYLVKESELGESHFKEYFQFFYRIYDQTQINPVDFYEFINLILSVQQKSCYDREDDHFLEVFFN